jgi:outer membrane protein assembly factor BamB
VFVADGGATAFAVDTESGQEIWSRRMDDHIYAKTTGSLTYYDGRVCVPVAGVGEEGQRGSSKYECCTFRVNSGYVSLIGRPETCSWGLESSNSVRPGPRTLHRDLESGRRHMRCARRTPAG